MFQVSVFNGLNMASMVNLTGKQVSCSVRSTFHQTKRKLEPSSFPVSLNFFLSSNCSIFLPDWRHVFLIVTVLWSGTKTTKQSGQSQSPDLRAQFTLNQSWTTSSSSSFSSYYSWINTHSQDLFVFCSVFLYCWPVSPLSFADGCLLWILSGRYRC